MSDHPLDNPVWKAISAHQARFGQRNGAAVRYQADVTPIVAVADGSREAAAQLAAMISPDEQLYGVGTPPGLCVELEVSAEEPLPQMICSTRIDPGVDVPVVALSEPHRADMLALAALVYPAYFRTRTAELGRYFGIFDGGRLAAMAGERMHAGTWREVSAVCTHPEYTGRGYAQRLMAELVNSMLGYGETPFLHVSAANTRAIALYERIGFVERYRVPYWPLRRSDGTLPVVR